MPSFEKRKKYPTEIYLLPTFFGNQGISNMAPIIFIFVCTSSSTTSDSESKLEKKSRKRGVRATDKGLIKMKEAMATQIRDDKPITQQGLADEAFLSIKTVQRFLTGEKVDQVSAMTILRVLNLEPQDILEKT